MKTHLKAFFAGFLSTLVFHQGALFILNILGIVDRAPFNMTPTWPMGVPAIISVAFFGGLWSILIWHFIKNDENAKLWLKALVFGAIGPTLVFAVVVAPLKGLPVAPAGIVTGLFLNGVWGVGIPAFAKLLKA